MEQAYLAAGKDDVILAFGSLSFLGETDPAGIRIQGENEMLDLQEIRNKIDEIDAGILSSFEQRMELAEQVAAYKISAGKPVFDGKRRAEKLKNLEEAASTPFNARGARELFQHIIAVSRMRQYQLLAERGVSKESYEQVDSLPAENARVVFQGVEGAYSFAAMRSFFGEKIRSTHVETWREAMEQVAAGEADYAVLPIEIPRPEASRIFMI